jgi:hypothetical protein
VLRGHDDVAVGHSRDRTGSRGRADAAGIAGAVPNAEWSLGAATMDGS